MRAADVRVSCAARAARKHGPVDLRGWLMRDGVAVTGADMADMRSQSPAARDLVWRRWLSWRRTARWSDVPTPGADARPLSASPSRDGARLTRARRSWTSSMTSWSRMGAARLEQRYGVAAPGGALNALAPVSGPFRCSGCARPAVLRGRADLRPPRCSRTR